MNTNFEKIWNLLHDKEGDLDIKTKVDADGKYIRTPWTLCEEIIAQIKDSAGDLSKKKVLVVDTVEFIPVLLAFGVNKCNITYVAPYEFKGKIAKALGVNVVQESLFTWKTNMKFDVVVGNPPYTDGVWKEFLAKFISIADDKGIVCSINPDSTMNHSKTGKELREFFLSNGIQIKKNCANSFPNISMPSISYILFNKSLSGKADVFAPDSIEFAVTSKVLALKSAELIINSGKTETAQLRKAGKLLDNPFNGARQIIESVSKTGINYKFINPADEKSQSKSFNVQGRVLITYQHFGINMITPVYEIADISIYAYSINIHIIKINENETLNGFNSVYLSKLYRFVLSQLRGSHTMTRFPYIQALPKLDLSRIWPSSELYAHFNLTQEEIDYIEATIK